ncbi:hypothetical protein QE152_g1897 [Popillia japonica]|uniref:Uncharacterized protein n=1 Tax=Popillia japonica TaxID=7064 RepID=A0AAW1N0N8_POPJA
MYFKRNARRRGPSQAYNDERALFPSHLEKPHHPGHDTLSSSNIYIVINYIVAQLFIPESSKCICVYGERRYSHNQLKTPVEVAQYIASRTNQAN